MIRVVAYALIFPVFLLGAALFSLSALVRSWRADDRIKRRKTQEAAHRGTRLLFLILNKTGLLSIRTCGFDKSLFVKEPCVLVANHPSMLDAMLFLSITPHAVCVMKSTLLRLPIIGTFARRAGYIPYGEASELLRRAREAVGEGSSVVIFPEGTRSPQRGVGGFQRGAARIALEAEVPLEAFRLDMNPVVLGRGLPWWSPPPCRVVLGVKRLGRLSARISPKGASLEDIRRESVRLTEELEELIRSSLL